MARRAHDRPRPVATQFVHAPMLIVLGALAAALLILLAASAIASARARRRFEAETAMLLDRGRAAPAERVRADGTLPPPVARYLAAARSVDRPAARIAIVRQRGSIRARIGGPWMRFDSEQVYTLRDPAFVWWARARVAPLVTIVAQDELIDGHGNMRIRLLGLRTIADARGPEIDQGAALRYWGEAITFPEVVVSPHLRWDAIDDRRARFTVVDVEPRVSAVVEFDAEGWPVATRAERYRDVGGKGVLTPWSGISRDWTTFDGRRFPRRWESIWHLPEGDFTAVTMEILEVRTE